jgi:hypothetical protein
MRKIVDVSFDLYMAPGQRITLGAVPDDAYPISMLEDGTVLSTYGDVSWDLSPYSTFGTKQVINFPFANKKHPSALQAKINAQSRWFLHLIIEDRKPAHFAIGTLKRYVSGIAPIAEFANRKKIDLGTLLSQWTWMKEFMETGPSSNVLRTLAPLLAVLRKIPTATLGFEPVGSIARKALSQEISLLGEETLQHPPVPYRILSLLISRLTEYVSDFEAISDAYLDVVRACNRDYLTGRSQSGQEKNIAKGLTAGGDAVGETMASLLDRYGLTEYFQKYGLRLNINGLVTGLYSMQSATKYLGHIYSGMRDTEMTTLPLDCLQTSTSSGRKHYLIVGDTTKLAADGVDRVRWVTSKEGHQAIRCAQKIANALYEEACGPDFRNSMKGSRFFLFVTPSSLKFGGGKKSAAWPPSFGTFDTSVDRERLSRFLPLITEVDLLELEKIDDERAWRSESSFEVGKPWPLSTHQLRRSLALYAQRSGLVSLPSLRRQLKHISEAMSTYYAQGSAFATNFIGKNPGHFGNEWRRVAPVSAALSYELNVLGATHPLFGGHIHWIKNRLGDKSGDIAVNRKDTVTRFKSGELSYRETILGGCTKVGPCDRASIELYNGECLNGCANLAGNVGKLRLLTNAQAKFVAELTPGTNEYATESHGLAALQKALSTVEEQ